MLFLVIVGAVIAAVGYAATKSDSPAKPYAGIIKIVGMRTLSFNPSSFSPKVAAINIVVSIPIIKKKKAVR